MTERAGGSQRFLEKGHISINEKDAESERLFHFFRVIRLIRFAGKALPAGAL